MKLYYSPGACSLAAHIALEEMEADYRAVKVDLSAHETEDGRDFHKISERGYVPALETDDGLLTENPAVLMYLADRSEGVPEGWNRYKILEWIGYVGTELHAKAFGPIFAALKKGDKEAGEKAKPGAAKKLEQAASLMDGDGWLVGEAPTVADNYLLVMTLWAGKFGVETPRKLKDFRARNRERDAVRRAMEAEGLA